MAHVGAERVGLDLLAFEVARGGLGIVVQAGGALVDLGQRGGAQLAHLQREDGGEPLAPLLEDQRRLLEQRAPLGERCLAPDGEGGGGEGEAGVDLCLRVGREDLEGLAGGGVHRGDGHAGTLLRERVRAGRRAPEDGVRASS